MLSAARFAADVDHMFGALGFLQAAEASLLFIVPLVKKSKCFTCSPCERRCYSRSNAAVPESQHQRIKEFNLVSIKHPDVRFRLLGIFPLVFFFAQAAHYWRINQLGHMLWMCNVGDLLLAVGLFLRQPVLIRIAVIWMIPGFVIWFRFVVLEWGLFFSSVLAHVGGILVSIVAGKKVGMDRNAWLYAFGWYVLIQILSRLLTAPDLNVNLSHRIQPGFERVFSAYWEFWLTAAVATAIVLWLLAYLLALVWPTPMPEADET